MTEPHAPQGVFAAALTPLTADLEPDAEALVAHGGWLLENGCDGLAFLGTTGEANSLSVPQRLRVIETVTEAFAAPGAGATSGLMVGTGCCALADTVRLTRAALDGGCPAVLVLPPFYYKNVGDDGVFRAYAEVIERVGDARLRVYLYHFPQMSAVPIGHGVIERLLAAYPDTVAGVKDSSGQWENTATLIRDFPALAVFSGSERFLLDNLRAGGPGCISATVNVTAPLAQRVRRAAAAPDGGAADALQKTLTSLRRALEGYPAIAALKYLTSRRTGRPGWLNIAPPLVMLDAARQTALLSDLERVGFFEAVPQMAATAPQRAAVS